LKSDVLFHISVIDAGLNLKRHLETYPDVTVTDAVRQLRAGPVFRSSLNYDAAISICEEHGMALFCSSEDRTEELRNTLFRLAVRLRPLWAKVSFLGRDRVRAVLSSDQAQCLRYAGLLGAMDDSVRQWWDELAAYFRAEQSQKFLEIGRQGEQLSFRLEVEMLKKLGINDRPIWISVEDNTAGYDIMSYRRTETGELTKLFIEVKSTTTADCVFILTRHEWDVAAQAGSSFQFHFWYLPTPAIWIATLEELAPHIPSDNGLGCWDKVRLNFKSRQFEPVSFGLS